MLVDGARYQQEPVPHHSDPLPTRMLAMCFAEQPAEFATTVNSFLVELDNHAMIAAAVRAGFVLEGTSRDAAWLDGGFADGVTLSQLSGEWSPAGRPTGR
jgi:RimJ/RimL family protein N-acetyltransferase